MKRFGKVISWIIAIGMGIVLGMLISPDLFALEARGFGPFSTLMLIYLVIFPAWYLNVIVHEAGHLVFGLLTGYKFSSFRIFNRLWMRDANGKMRVKRYRLPGTAGQCLMEPPELVNGQMPTMLYNFGGVILNLVFSALCLGIWFVLAKVCGYRGIVTMFLMTNAVYGVYSALVNGIPLHLGMIDNDGMNALSLRRNPRAVRASWIMKKYMAMQVRGEGIMDVPEEWLEMPSDEELKNSYTAWPSGLIADRLMTEHRFEEAASLMDHLLEGKNALVELTKMGLRIDRIFCECMCGRDPEKFSELRTKKLLKYMKATKDKPSTISAEYAYALLVEKDADKACKLKAQYERVAKKYPYADILRIGRELMQLADEKKEI